MQTSYNVLTEENIIEFKEKGYTLILDGLTKDELSILHEEADTLTNHLISEGYDLATDLGCVIEPWTCGYFDDCSKDNIRANYKELRNSIYFGNNDAANVSDLILKKYGREFASKLMEVKAEEPLYLLNEQFIVKPPFSFERSQFVWHRDSDYYHDTCHRNEKTIACWTALDDVYHLNGTIEIQDFLGFQKILELPAGSILFMSNQLLHKSTGNASNLFRRAYMTQYSATPLSVGLAVRC